MIAACQPDRKPNHHLHHRPIREPHCLTSSRDATTPGPVCRQTPQQFPLPAAPPSPAVSVYTTTDKKSGDSSHLCAQSRWSSSTVSVFIISPSPYLLPFPVVILLPATFESTLSTAIDRTNIYQAEPKHSPLPTINNPGYSPTPLPRDSGLRSSGL